jgi:hypothetical protein
VRFANFLSGEFTTMALINPPEGKLAKCTSVQWAICLFVAIVTQQKMTSNTISIVAFCASLKCPHKINFNTECPLLAL